ncbi:MAG TPA: 2'-5' RNA ligase family protein [Gaiellaceae bacterium]|nr:2'-5' RNA ligase family protein [Gaiellaceae bacterium]
MSSELQHYLVVPFPEVAAVVDPWREQSLGSGPSNGVPAHVTLLAPCPGDPEAIAGVLAGTAAFDVEFRELRRFTEVPTLYLAPVPAEPFVRLTKALVERFPDWPPYGGSHGTTVIPHLTVTQGPAEEAAEAAVAEALPLRARAREAVLLAEREPGRFETAARLPFEGA